jgi:cell division protein FtsB
MTEHASEIIPLLAWMILAVGGALLGLLIWIGKRLQAKVDALPDQVSVQVSKVHDAIVKEMADMNRTHASLERDVREQFSKLDRRVTKLEVMCDMHHGRSVAP